MGAVTDSNYLNSATFADRPVDAIFKYDGDYGNGDPGKITYPIFAINTVKQAANLTSASGRNVMPVMVVYTAEMSGGVSTADFDDSANRLTMHFINLMITSSVLQSYKTEDNPFPGSLILNPDLLGMVAQQNLWNIGGTGQLNTLTIEVESALQKSYWFLTTKHGWSLTLLSGTVISVPGKTPTEFIQYVSSGALAAQGVYSAWDIKSQWETAASALLSSAPTGLNEALPSMGNDFPGWIQANNWIIKHFGPDITFGWQSNVWSNGTSNWVHQDLTSQEIDSAQAEPIADLWSLLYVYNGTYKPDFVVFDKYEMDSIAAASIGYFWNQRDIGNYLEFVRLLSGRLGNVPAMLWQVPGGHLQVSSGDMDSRDSHCSTECDFFLGGSLAQPNLSNLKSYILNTLLPAGIYGTTSVQTYLTQNGQDWSSSHLALAKNSRVFAILWGGGQTTSVGTFPSDDGGYLASRIAAYYLNPLYLNTEP